MFSLEDRPYRLCDRISRRECLRVGGLSALGLSLPALMSGRQSLASEAQAAVGGSFGKAKSCIILFLMGGPPQHETWDPKPETPVEIRGDLKPIESRTPGLMVGELMPRTALMTDRIAVLRAMSTHDNAHSSSGYWMLTGTPHVPMNSENALPGAPNNWPSLGGIVQHLRPNSHPLPAAVTLPEEIWNTGRIVWPGQDAGFLGLRSHPWLLTCDPNSPEFQVPGTRLPAEIPAARFDERRSLLATMNEHLDAIERSGAPSRWDTVSQQAIDIMVSAAGRKAFDINAESNATRDRYGRSRFGQSVLLARRLVEAGVSLVQVNWTRPKTDADVNPVWDTHSDNAKRLKEDLMPPMDLAYTALLEDLEQRGLLDETLVVWMGEFGRSPKINALAGRDHWGHVYSAALAGAGVRGGTVFGASDKLGGQPSVGRTEPQDLSATIFHSLGFSPSTEMHDTLGRPLPISRGRVIDEVLV